MEQVIDPRAIIDPTVVLGDNVHVGAWSVIGEGVRIGDNTVIGTHVVIEAGTAVGSNCQIGPHCVVGAHPLAPSRLSDLGPNATPLGLGDRCTLTALSRVVETVPAASTVAGNPAQLLLDSQ